MIPTDVAAPRRGLYFLLTLLVIIDAAFLTQRACSPAGEHVDVAALNAAHDAEIKSIEAALQQRELEHQQELARLQSDVAIIEAGYADARAQLQVSSEVEQRSIVQQYGSSNEALAALAADRLGLVLLNDGGDQ